MSLALFPVTSSTATICDMWHPRLTVEDVLALSKVSQLDTGGGKITPELQAQYDVSRSHQMPGRPLPSFESLHLRATLGSVLEAELRRRKQAPREVLDHGGFLFLSRGKLLSYGGDFCVCREASERAQVKLFRQRSHVGELA